MFILFVFIFSWTSSSFTCLIWWRRSSSLLYLLSSIFLSSSISLFSFMISLLSNYAICVCFAVLFCSWTKSYFSFDIIKSLYISFPSFCLFFYDYEVRSTSLDLSWFYRELTFSYNIFIYCFCLSSFYLFDIYLRSCSLSCCL